jgi:hypothetical protein
VIDYPTCGPEFRWFAWRPVRTDDRGWRWLRFVYRQRVFCDGGTFFMQWCAPRG